MHRDPQYETEDCQPGECDDSCDQDGRVFAEQSTTQDGNFVVIEAGNADVIQGMQASGGNQSYLTVDQGATACPTPSSTLSLQDVYSSGCPLAQYKFSLESTGGNYFVYVDLELDPDAGGENENLLWYSIDNDESYAGNQSPFKVVALEGNRYRYWTENNTQPLLGSGEHDLTIWGMKPGLEFIRFLSPGN